MRAEIGMRTAAGSNEYQFTLSHVAPDGLPFAEEAFRFHRTGAATDSPWQKLPVGGTEARIVDAAHSEQFPGRAFSASLPPPRPHGPRVRGHGG